MDKKTRNLLILTLTVCLVALTVQLTVGALPNQMKSARLTGATLASTIHTHVGNLETAITDILGIPLDTNISAAGFTWAATGLTGIELGHATDTTIARVSAGVISVEGSTVALASNNLSFFAATTSAQLAGVLSDETGSGLAVFSTAPTFTTSITDPLVIGGTAAGSTLSLRSTSGIGTSDAIIFQVGNNGATEAGRFINIGALLIGTTDTTGAVAGDVKIKSGTSFRANLNAGGGSVLLIGSEASSDSVLLGDNSRSWKIRTTDISGGAIETVTAGAADSGGVGFRYLRIPN